MNIINIKKPKFNKSKIIFIMGLIFFSTSIFTKIHNTSKILKENSRKSVSTSPNNQIVKKGINRDPVKIKYIMDISDTLGEAISYVNQNYKDTTNLQVKIVLKDSIEGLSSISLALEAMDDNIDNKNIKLKTDSLKSLIKDLINSIDKNNMKMAETIIESKLSNEYNYWKKDIEDEFR